MFGWVRGSGGVTQSWEGETLLIAQEQLGMGVDIWIAWPGLAWPGQLKGPERAMLEIERGSGVGLRFTSPGLG